MPKINILKTLFHKSPKGCSLPFTNLEILKTRDNSNKFFVTPCCIGWYSPETLATLEPSPIEEDAPISLIDSEFNKNLRIAIISNNYTFCSKTQCPILKRQENFVSTTYLATLIGPDGSLGASLKNVGLASDPSCNLKCPSCREDYIIEKDTVTVSLFKALIEAGTTVIAINGAGEFLLNKDLMGFLKESTEEDMGGLQELRIITNGTLFTKNVWESLAASVKARIGSILVSLDAAFPDTYSKIRVGSVPFERVLANLYFLSDLYKDPAVRLSHLCIRMVIQKLNYLEILDFLKLGHHLGVSVDYILIQSWNLPGASERELSATELLHAHDLMRETINYANEHKIHLTQDLLA